MTIGKCSARQAIACSSSCLVYGKAARRVLYIRETCRQLNNRFGEHLQNVGHGKDHGKEHKIEHSDTNVSRHISIPMDI